MLATFRFSEAFRPRCLYLWLLLVSLILFCTLAVWVAGAVSDFRNGAADTQSRDNAFSFAVQLYSFNETFGCLPPPIITDKDGKPLYSWRVLVGGELPIPEQFDYTKPWDDPVNLRLDKGENGWRLRRFSYPSIEREKIGQTSYFYALNAEDRWPRDFFIDPRLRPKILLVESQWRSVHWSEPVDFVYEGSGKDFLKELRKSKSPYPIGFNCVTSDCATFRIPTETHDSDGLTLTFFARSKRPEERAERDQVEALIVKLIKVIADPASSENGSRRPGLLYLGELGPRAAAAVPEIRRIIAAGDQKNAMIAAMALAKIEK